ncbi:SH3 domain-containing protein [bacterium]|nr:MAG: SH3 domain-containing protein [bacterium]
MTAALALLFVAQSAPSLSPVDESPRDPSLVAFLNNLRRAVQTRDAKGLLARIDPKIRTSFGGGGGLADFRQFWRPENPDAPVWREFEAILKLGGAFEGETYWMPTTYAKWPEAYDSFSYGAATGSSVALRGAPNADAKVVARLNYTILKAEPEKKGWLAVEVPNGPKGFVHKTDFRRPIDYRLAISKVKDRWLINTMVAGD